MSAQLVLSFVAAAERLDMAAMLKCLHPDCEFRNQPLPGWTVARGLPAVSRQLRALLWLVRDFKVLSIRKVKQVDGVLSFVRSERLNVLGRIVDLEISAEFRFRDGRIVYWQDDFSLGELRSVLFKRCR